MEKVNNDQAIPLFFLPSSVVKFKGEDESAWESDHDYFHGLAACESVRLLAFRFKRALGGSIYNMNLPEMFAKPQGTMSAQELGHFLEQLLAESDEKFNRKLEATRKKPLVEKLADSLEASDNARALFRHVVFRSSGFANYEGRALQDIPTSGPFDNSNFNLNSLPTGHLRQLLGIPLKEVMNLASPESKWVKEQLYVQCTSISNNLTNLSDALVRVLMGLDISVGEYNSIGSKTLCKILVDDEWFQQTKSGQAIKAEADKTKAAMEQVQKRKEKGDTAPSLLKIALQENSSQNPNKKRRVLDVLSVLTSADVQKKEQAEVPVTAESVETKSMETEDTKEPSVENDKKIDEDDLPKKSSEDEFGPYKSDLDYLEDQVALMRLESRIVRQRTSLSKFDLDDDNRSRVDQMLRRTSRRASGVSSVKQLETNIANLERQLIKLNEKITAKLARTQQETNRQMRLEQLCDALDLCKFEKYCILAMVTFVIVPGGMHKGSAGSLVGTLIDSFCATLEERMESRRFFYRSSTLIREGILSLSQTDFKTDLSMCKVDLDRRMLDFIVGLSTEFSEIVDGSHLYIPNVCLADVVLPKETKKRVCDAVMHHDEVKNIFEKLEVDQKITYGLGHVLLFYGHSGTGKTMLANAIATELKQKILLVNFPTLGLNESGAIIKFLFREARINKALLFFDECESLFLTRDKGGRSVNMILTEMERFDGLCILATNRAYDLDEAMHRRISLAIEFRKPDHILREKIWETLQPPKLPVDDDVSFGVLARKFELTGGLIKNAWLQSVSLMVRRSGKSISQEDLLQAAGEQVIGQLSMEDFDRRVIPTCGVDAMAIDSTVKEALYSIVHHAKAQAVLFGQWGFEKMHRSTTGISALFTGPPGTGKTMAAEAIGFDLGRPLLVVNVAELVDKYVGQTGKNIQAVFQDAKKKDAVLVFDEAEGLFASRESGSSGSTSRHDAMNVGLLLQYIENFSGICIAITNMKSSIDEAFFRRFRFVVEFALPDLATREKIWKLMVPKDCPLDKNVDFRRLALQYAMSGGNIKNALLRAATCAALRDNEKQRVVTMNDLDKACTAESDKNGKLGMSMYT